MPDFTRMMKRQQILGDFGELALHSQDLDHILSEACRLVSEALEVERSKILEILQDERQFLVRAGVGCNPGIVGNLRLPMEEHSSQTFAITVGEAVVSRDVSSDERFGVPPFMRDAGVAALVNVPIFLPGGRAFGLLQVDATEPRDFGEEDVQFLRIYTAILGPAIDRLLMAGTLHSSEERFRLTVAAALDYAIFLTDPEDRITDWLPGAQAVFGWTAEEAVGQPAAILFTPEDQEKHQDRGETEMACREGVAPNVRWHICKDGRRVFIEGSTRALRDSSGTLLGFLKIGQDTTERLLAGRRLQEEKERFRVLVEGVPQLVWRSFGEGNWNWASPQWLDYTGQSQEESHGRGWLRAVHPDDREATLQAWREVRTANGLDVEFRLRRASDNRYRWHQTRSAPLRAVAGDGAPSGPVTEWLGTTTDIDDLKRLQERQESLVAELQHRTRNLLGVVRSIATRSFGASPERQEYEARLNALGRVQGFLSRSPEWEVPLLQLLEAELTAAGDGTSGRVAVEGPPVQLPGDKVQTLALALHELATNAVKHGAIGQTGARLKITWRLDIEETSRCLVLDWLESGVTMPAKPPEQRGYGRELIERALPYQLQARTQLRFRPDGVHCTIVLPLGEARMERRSA